MSGSVSPIGSASTVAPAPAAAAGPAVNPAPAAGFDRDEFVRGARNAMSNPLTFASDQIIRLTKPLGVDGRYAAGGLVTGKVLATTVKAGTVGHHFLQISRTEGIRVFAGRVGARGVARDAAQAFGKGWLRALAVTGVCLTAGIAVGFAAHRLDPPQATPPQPAQPQ